MNFLGTTDNQAVEVKVNNARALRLEPTAGTPNVIGGASNHFVTAGVVGAFIGGGGTAGVSNRVTDTYGAIGGGLGNAVLKNDSFIGGGIGNSVAGDRSVIAGGRDNTIRTNASNAAIGGGRDNVVTGVHGTIPGGLSNTATNNALAAGTRAKAQHPGAFVWADSQNADFASAANNVFLIRAAGGVGINTSNPQEAVHVAGRYLRVDGLGNEQVYIGGDGVSGDVQLGSLNGSVSNVTLWNPTAGRRMNLELDRLEAYSASLNGPLRLNNSNLWLRAGTDVNHGLGWYGSGKTFAGFAPDGPALFGFAGGLLGTTQGGDNYSLKWDTTGNVCVRGTVTCTSDRNAKENFAPVNAREVLAKVAALPITRWNYKQDAANPHLGPVAQDFHAAFGLGLDDKHIATVDADGVALAAIQCLNEKVEEQLQARDAEIRELRQSLAELKGFIQSLAR